MSGSPSMFTPIGSGGSSTSTSSGTGKNYLGTVNAVNNNGDFETGLTTPWGIGTVTLTSGLPTGVPTFGSGASGNLSISAVTSGKLAGTYSLSYASSAATTAGNMLHSDVFTIDLEDQAKVMTFKYYYSPTVGPTTANWSGTSSNSFGVAIYDVTNSAWIIPAGVYSMTQGSGVGIATGTFQTPSNGSQFRLCVYNANATAGAVTVLFDDFFLGPQTAPIGPVVTDWATKTVTGSWSTNTTYACRERQVGDTMEYEIQVSVSGAPTSATLTVNLPSGRTIDTSKIAGGTNSTPLGTALIIDASPSTAYNGFVYYNSTTSVAVLVPGLSSHTATVYPFSAAVTQAIPVTWASGDYINLIFSVPIVGLSSNVQMSNDTDTRVVSFTGTTTGGQSVTADVTNVTVVASKDTHAAWTGSTYVVPVAGDYVVSGMYANTTASNQNGKVFLNGTFVPQGWWSTTPAVATSASAGAILVPNCKPGDVLSLRSNVTSTTSVTNISIFRLSGPAVVAASERIASRYTTSAGQSIPHNTPTVVVFGTKDYTTHDSFNPSTGEFTAPRSDYYSVKAHTIWSLTPGGATNAFYMDLFKNGSSYSRLNTKTALTTGAQDVDLCGSDDIYLNAGEKISIAVFQNTGGAKSLVATSSLNYFSIRAGG